MANITYLLGAGASCGKVNDEHTPAEWLTPYGGLPLVQDITTRLDALFEGFNALRGDTKYNENLPEYNITSRVREDIFDHLLNSLTNLITELDIHASIDTLARKLYLINDPYLKEVKFFIDALFMFEQWIEGTDPRYDLFFATVFHKGGSSIIKPNNIKIITWNYDIQLELSLNNFFRVSKIKDIREDCRIINAFDTIIYADHYLEDFSIIKLNGTSCPNDFPFDLNIFNGERHLFYILNYVIAQYHHKIMMKKEIQNVRFSWESTNLNINIASEICKQTDILVVIGYSFPTFNREVDKLLIQSIKGLNRIFIQCPPEKYNSIKTRIEALGGVAPGQMKIFYPIIEHIDYLDEFYVPPEFN